MRCDFGHGRLQHSGLHRQLCDDKLECVVGMHRDVWIRHSAKNPLRRDVSMELTILGWVRREWIMSVVREGENEYVKANRRLARPPENLKPKLTHKLDHAR